ncbi:hypothetical protein PMAYCL1PPCAC_05110, partial [Pristionchus mayeri]
SDFRKWIRPLHLVTLPSSSLLQLYFITSFNILRTMAPVVYYYDFVDEEGNKRLFPFPPPSAIRGMLAKVKKSIMDIIHDVEIDLFWREGTNLYPIKDDEHLELAMHHARKVAQLRNGHSPLVHLYYQHHQDDTDGLNKQLRSANGRRNITEPATNNPKSVMRTSNTIEKLDNVASKLDMLKNTLTDEWEKLRQREASVE